MSKACFMGIDVGAGSLTAMIIAIDGRVLGSASEELTTRGPHPGWSEQDPHEWWHALCTCVPRALAQAGLPAGAIGAVAISAGAHTPVLVDAHGDVVRPAILWSDTRSAAEATFLQERHGDDILALGFNRPAPTWTLAQLLWLARHEPRALDRTRRLFVAKDWLRGQLTGGWETDPTEAVGTLLFDPQRGAWSERLCAMIGFDPAKLPPLVEPTDVVGSVSPSAARASGLAAGTPVVCGSSDTSVETFGAGAASAGLGAVKLATAATVTLVTEAPSPSREIINYPFCVPGHWYLIGATNSCASAHRWLCDTFFMHGGRTDRAAAFTQMDAAAAAVAAGSQGLIFHPYLQGERTPHWDPLLRGDFLGINFVHGPGHFVRALYEGIAFSLRDVFEVMRAQGQTMSAARIIGGGSRSATWRQIVADVLGVDILLPAVTDASFGAALIAATGVGAFPDMQAAAAQTVSVQAQHAPDAERHKRYTEQYAIYREAAAALVAVNHKLARRNEA